MFKELLESISLSFRICRVTKVNLFISALLHHPPLEAVASRAEHKFSLVRKVTSCTHVAPDPLTCAFMTVTLQ